MAEEDYEDLDLQGQGGGYGGEDDETFVDDDLPSGGDHDTGDEDGAGGAKKQKAAADAAPERELAELRSRVGLLERENEAYRWHLADTEKAGRDAEIASLKERESVLRASRKQALDADDMDAYDQADEELRQASIKRALIEHDATRAGPAAPAVQDDDPWNGVNPHARQWIEKNMDWFDKESPRYDSLKASAAVAIEQQHKDAYGANNPELYRVVDRELKKWERQRFAAANPRRAGQVAGVGRLGSASRQPGPDSPRLPGAEEKRAMIKAKLDPNNPRHVKAWRAAA